MSRVVDVNGRDRERLKTVFKSLSEQDAVVVLRDVEEIHQLGATIRSLAAQLGDAKRAAEVAEILRTSEVPSIEALGLLYRTVRHLRDRRYMSALFADLVAGLGLPEPLVPDAGYCRMSVPKLWNTVLARQELFGPENFVIDPHEAEPMVQEGGWGNAHRDIDVAHYHFQINFWFPLHDVDEKRTLLIFPEAYRRSVPQYGQLPGRDNPSQWGFGPALQIPLRFGDTLVFHSQQLHASPSQAPDKNRFTCEMRVASACHDDNATIYRRLFWNLGNFQAAGGNRSAAARAAPLAEPVRERTDLDAILAAETPQALFNGLFKTPAAALAASYVRRPDGVFADSLELDAAGWGRVVAALEKLPWCEDLGVAIARLLLYRGQTELALRLFNAVLKRTRSYFWPLEIGRLAAEARLYDLATTAFGVGEFRAGRSDIALNRYTQTMSAPRTPNQILQLLPGVAARAAAAFRRRAAIEKGQSARTTPTFDYNVFWPPIVAASFEHYDVLQVGELMVALRAGKPFHPEEVLDGATGVVVGTSKQDLAERLKSPLGERVEKNRELSGPGVSVGDYVVQRYLNAWYAIPKRCIPVDLLSQDLLKLPGVFRLGDANVPADAQAALTLALAAQHEQVVKEKTNLEQIVGEASRRGALRGIGKRHMDEDFLQYSFHDDRDAVVAALVTAAESVRGTVRLVGPAASVEHFAAGLRKTGRAVEHVAWSYGDPLPPTGLGDGILCQIPKSYIEWAIFSAVSAASQGRLQPVWRFVMKWSLLEEMLTKYEYNAQTLDELIKVYRGGSTEQVGRRSNETLEKLQRFCPIRGKTVIEFGPSDGNHTSDLLAAGAAHVQAVEGRTENVIKLLVAKHVMGWKNFDIAMDNFQALGPWAERRYDLVYAQGVYYHCQNPMVFLDNLTRLGDAIFIGGWAATDEKPPTAWVDLPHDGAVYRGKPYVESFHFLSGLASVSYMVDKRDIQTFFERRGYVMKYCDVGVSTGNLGTEFVRMLVMKE